MILSLHSHSVSRPIGPSASALCRPLAANRWAGTMTSGTVQKPTVPTIRLSACMQTDRHSLWASSLTAGDGVLKSTD